MDDEFERDCDWCGDTFITEGPADYFCGDECRKESDDYDEFCNNCEFGN